MRARRPQCRGHRAGFPSVPTPPGTMPDAPEPHDEDPSLSTRSKTEIAVGAAMQLVPYGLGSLLAAAYFGGKNERRFQRIEELYRDVAADVAALGEDAAEAVRRAVEASDPERLASILEGVHDQVEAEALSEKRAAYRRYFAGAVLTGVTAENYEGRRLVLDVLGRLTPLQLRIVADLARENLWVDPKAIRVDGADPSVIEGAVALLQSHRVLDEAVRTSMVVKGEGIVNRTEVQLSGLGYRLHALCLDPPKPETPPTERDRDLIPTGDDALESAPYELTDDEVLGWFTESPVRGTPAADIVDARRPTTTQEAYSPTTVRFEPTVPGRWVVRYRIAQADATNGVPLPAGLKRVLDTKEPGYVAAGEAPFRHVPHPALGGRKMASDTFVLSAIEMDRVMGADFADHPEAQAIYGRGQVLSVERAGGFQLTFWPADGDWAVDWVREDGAPLPLPPALRSVLSEKEPHRNPPG